MISAPLGFIAELMRLPEYRLDVIAAGFLACAVVIYLARVFWIAVAQARRLEKAKSPSMSR